MRRLPRSLLLAAGTAAAQGGWPNKPVRIVVPFAAGGTTDILARAVAPELSKAFGQQFIVDNRAGAGGNMGAEIVAKAPNDGYTLLMGTVGTHGINRALYPKLPYDPIKDFAPITLVAGGAQRDGDECRQGQGAQHQQRGRLHQVRQGQPGQAQHGLERQRHLDPPGRRAVQDA